MSAIARSLKLDFNPSKPGLRFLLGVNLVLLGAIVLIVLSRGSTVFPATWNLHLREPIDSFQSWVIGHRATHPLFLYFFNPLSALIDARLRTLEAFLLALPWPALVILLFAIGYKAAGPKVACFAAAGLLIMGLFGLWKPSMATFALMGVAVFITLLIGIPLGILSARSPRFEAILRPLLDAMQTIPAFVYLIPVVLFFGIARVPSVIATVIYALPPAIRLTSLGIRQVTANTLEAADAFGSTPWQKLVKVQLPLALPSILLGVNQTIMMALGIVVIAALIGAGGLGLEVLNSLRNLYVGQALEAGLAIVLIAVIFDRISYGASQESKAALQPKRRRKDGTTWARFADYYIYWGTVAALILLFVVLNLTVIDLSQFPWHFSIRAPVDALVRWMRDNLYQISHWPIGTGPFSDFVTRDLLNPLRSLLLNWLPWPVVLLGLAALAYQAGGWRLALFSAVCLLGLGLLGMWEQSMDTLSQVLVSVLLSLLLGVPLGILAARSNVFTAILRPILDFLQTIPPFVYLVPVIMLFNIGRVPGIIASVLYALPPMIRLTELGIRQVAPTALEAAEAFGSTSRQKLFKVELPLALPSIMMGVNQTVMMVLSMVIIAGLVGGGALGFEAINGLAKSQLGRGIEAGLAILLLAMVLDRITQAWAGKRQ
ncbi:MAG: ABC transporter permease subunit [Caldilineaceae bacterium]